MAKQKEQAAPKEMAAIASVVLEPSTDHFEDAVIGGMDEVLEKEELIKEDRYGPPMWTKEWQDYLAGQFFDSEKDAEGNPNVNGFRRVAKKLLGTVLFSGLVNEPTATYIPDDSRVTMLNPVVAVYKIKIAWTRPEDVPEGCPALIVEFSDAADVMFGNTDPDFSRFPTATAVTRAESRCYRKALQYNRCSAEEKTVVSTEESSPNGLIRESDIHFLDTICRRLNVNVIKYINSGEKQYESIEEIPFGTAQKMLKRISAWQNDMTKINPDLKGYKKGWDTREII